MAFHPLAHRGGAFFCALRIGRTGKHDTGEKRQAIDRDNVARQVRRFFADHERDRAAEAVADDRGLVEFLRAGVGDDLIARVIEEVVGFDRGHPAESRDRDNVAFVFVLQVFHRVVPDRAGRGETGNEDDRSTVADDFDVDDFGRAGRANGGSRN